MKIPIGFNTTGGAFGLPLDLVTQTLAILAKKGAGKSYTASVMVEGLLTAGQVPVIIDPTGAWWGLKSSAKGDAPGFPMVVFGGDHADLPLEETAGEATARAIVEQRFPAIIDLSLMRKAQSRRFLIPFLETLYRLNRLPLMLIVDEADDVCPQKPFGDEAQLVGALEDVVKRGRRKGIGCTLLTQRPADLAKQVLTQCEMIVALRMSHPLDIKAVMDWVNVHADPAVAKRMVESLPSLDIGTAWFWSPGWGNIFEKVMVSKRTTFDSGATPKAGEVVVTPKKLAQVDIVKLGSEIMASAQRAKDNDPKELRRQNELLKQQLKLAQEEARENSEAHMDMSKVLPVPHRVDVPVLTDHDRELLSTCKDLLVEGKERTDHVEKLLAKLAGELNEKLAVMVSSVEKTKAENHLTTTPQSPYIARKWPTPMRGRFHPGNEVQVTNGRKISVSIKGEALPKGERAVLIACAQYPEAVERETLTQLTGYKRSSRDAYIQRLREKGYVETAGDRIGATGAGIAALGSDYEPLPVGSALRTYWLQRLPEGERRILEALIQAHPERVTGESLDHATGYKRSSRDAYLQRLSARKLVDRNRDGIRASQILFD